MKAVSELGMTDKLGSGLKQISAMKYDLPNQALLEDKIKANSPQ